MQSSQHQSSRAKRTHQRMFGACSYGLRAPGNDTGLWSTHQLVGAERDECGAVGQCLTSSGFAAQPARGTIGEPRTCRIQQTGSDVGHDGYIEGRQFPDRCVLDEAFESEVGRVDFQDHRHICMAACECFAIVVETSAIRRADIDESGAGLFHDVGYAKASTDFDTFAATDEDLPIAAESSQHQHDRGGIVVDDESRVGSAQTSQKSADPLLTAAAFAGGEIELEVLSSSRLHMCHGRATQIGVGDDTGRIDHRHQQARGNGVGDSFGQRGIAESDCLAGGIDEKWMRKTAVREGTSHGVDTGRSVVHLVQRYCATVILFLLFVVLPIAELYTIIRMSDYIGFLNTLGVILLVAVLGSYLVKREGLRVWRRFNESIASGRVPTSDIVDGVLILAAGALLVTPGFLSDVFGLLMLFPPTRVAFRSLVMRRSRKKVIVIRTVIPPGDVIDTDATDIRGDLS